MIQQALPSLSGLSTVVVAPCTSVLEGLSLRPLLQPSATNGLHQASTVMVDRLQAAGRDRIRHTLGTLSDEETAEVDAALMLVLGLGAKPSRPPR